MFRHFHVIIRQFKTNALLSYTRSSNCSCLKYNYLNIIYVTQQGIGCKLSDDDMKGSKHVSV
jgi:hypothetical protein